MNFVQLTPGAGPMYCGNCFRDNALVAALRRAGHEALMVPLYLPLTLDEVNQSAGTPLFFNGINVYLEQKSALFRRAPAWVHRLFSSPRLLKWAAGRAAKTRAADLGDLTLSMILGEEGRQARELVQLVDFLKTHAKPDIICLSNALLIGMARQLKQELGVPVACVLQGEDTFLDALPESHRDLVWRTLAERARDVDLFIPPTQYFGDLMARRLHLPPEKVKVIFNGLNPEGWPEPGAAAGPPIVGYFARMCREKGLDTLVRAFVLLKRRGRVPGLRLKVGGGCGPSDEPFVMLLKAELRDAGVLGDAEFHPNVDRAEKQAFYHGLSVFSVPAMYGEAFGLYQIEAFASGVPVVQPRHAGFPEIVHAAGAGILCAPGDPAALADGLEELLLDAPRRAALGAAGRQAVREIFNADQMARETLRICGDTIQKFAARPPARRA